MKFVTFCDVTFCDNATNIDSIPISLDHCLQMGFPRSYGKQDLAKFAVSRKEAPLSASLRKSSWDKRMMLHLPETIYTLRPRRFFRGAQDG